MRRRENKYLKSINEPIVSPLGQWAYPGKVTLIPDSNITMKGVHYPVLGISNTGDAKMMMPGFNYKFKGDNVTEYPMMQIGGYNIGNEYDITEDEYQKLLDSGYEVEIIDDNLKKHKGGPILKHDINNPDLKKIYQKKMRRNFLKWQKTHPQTGKSTEEAIQLEGVKITPKGNNEYTGEELQNRLNNGELKWNNLSLSGKRKVKDYNIELADNDLTNVTNQFQGRIMTKRNQSPLTSVAMAAAFSPLILAGTPILGSAAKTFVGDIISPAGLSALKTLGIGTAGFEAMEQGTRVLNKVLYGNDKGWTATAKDLMFDKETQQKHPIVTDVAAAATNPGSYLGAGVKELEYIRGFLPMLYNTFKNNARTTYNIGKSLYNAANKAVKKSTTNLTKPAALSKMDWDKLYFNAIKNGNMAEAQRLRDLHFMAKAPNTKAINSDGSLMTTTHGTNNKFNSFLLEGDGINHGDPGDFGFGHYFYPDKRVSSYGDNQMYEYLNIEKPYTGEWNRNFNRGQSGAEYTKKNMKYVGMSDADIESELQALENADGVFAISPYSGRIQEIVVPRGEQIKSADAIVYDDAGNVIPLSKRDNFGINDIRYGYAWGEQPKGTLMEDWTDFNTMVQRMDAPVRYGGVNPFEDGNMTGFRKWALENGAAPEKIMEVEKKYSKNNWKKLKQFKFDDYYTSYSPEDNTIYVNKNESEFNQIFPHEVEHKLFYLLFNENRNSITINEINKAFKSNNKFWSIPSTRYDSYFIGNNFEELLTRFTQIKNALGIKEQRALTEDELRRAYNMFKNGDTRIANNNMKEFFENIKDWKEAAKLSGKALSLSLMLNTNQINEKE